MGAVRAMVRPLLGRLRRDPDVAALVERGLTLGEGVHIGRDAYLGDLCPWLLSIGDHSTIGMHVTILVHDSSPKRLVGWTTVSPVSIGRNVYVGGFSMILPGVTIGDRAVIGAGSVVTSDVPAGAVARGNPARVTGTVEDFVARHTEQLREAPRFDDVWAIEGIGGRVAPEMRRRMRDALRGGRVGYIP